MDIRCSKCGEPWAIDSLYDLTAENESTFDLERGRFYSLGCEAFGTGHGEVMPMAAEIAGMLQDIMGDDIDAVASELEDAEYMGLI